MAITDFLRDGYSLYSTTFRNGPYELYSGIK